MLSADTVVPRASSGDGGYTLTEMLVVIGIIGLIAAVLTPSLIGQLGRARVKAASLQVENVASQVELFMADTGRYPTAQEGLSALIAQPSQEAEAWAGPYMRDQKSLQDPWGRALTYSLEGEGRYTVASLGADGKLGGSGVDRDIRAPSR
jgi:general secretion pathway protein G